MQFVLGMWPKYNKKFISGVAVHQKTQGSQTVGLCRLYDIRDMVGERKEQRKVQVAISEPIY